MCSGLCHFWSKLGHMASKISQPRDNFKAFLLFCRTFGHLATVLPRPTFDSPKNKGGGVHLLRVLETSNPWRTEGSPQLTNYERLLAYNRKARKYCVTLALLGYQNWKDNLWKFLTACAQQAFPVSSSMAAMKRFWKSEQSENNAITSE